MKKKVQSIEEQHPITKELAQIHPCYILITCDPPSSDGHMQVRMSYEGDSVLVSYLIQGAQSVIDESIADEI